MNPPIAYFNNLEDIDQNSDQLLGIDTTYYSCIQDPNDPNGTTVTDTNGNITCDPNFAYDTYPYGYYHLNYGSHCKDAGDGTYVDANDIDEVDMDGDNRDGDGYVDMGADEIACSDTSNYLDWTSDGVVNFEEYSLFSTAWLSSDPNNLTNWNPVCDINEDNIVDLSDFELFCNEWLWEACWRDSYVETMMMGMSSMSMGIESSTLLSESLSVEPVPSVIAPEMVFPESFRDGFEDEYNNMTEIVEFLEKIWEEEPEIKYEISEDDWKEFMTHVYRWLYTVEDAYLLQLKSEELESVRQ